MDGSYRNAIARKLALSPVEKTALIAEGKSSYENSTPKVLKELGSRADFLERVRGRGADAG